MSAGSGFVNPNSAGGSRVKSERDELGVLGLLAIKERFKKLFGVFFQHRKRIKKITQLLLLGGCREPAAADHPAVDCHIP
jgi:hypothetical protein